MTRHIIDSLGSGLVTTDLNGKIYLFNPAAAEISGRSSEEVVGSAIREIFPALPADAGVGNFEVTIAGRGKPELCLQFSVTPLTMDSLGPTGYVWCFDDVTEMREMERELRKKERMAAIGVMSAGIAHEIRNPLASITGSFRLLQSELKLESEQMQLVRIIARETERLNQTINDFLLYARPSAPRLKPVRLDQVISDSVQLIKNSPDLGPDHNIESDLEPVTANLDEGMMRQVLYNLASNAFKAMPDGGTFRIVLRRKQDGARLRFEDSGRGMSGSEVDSAFLPFNSAFRTGTGLGLSIVYQIVTSHKGSISVRSKPGEGTTFTVDLPSSVVQSVSDPEVQPAREAAAPAVS